MTLDPRIEERLAKFKTDLKNRSLDSVVRRHITTGDCYILDADKYYDLREEVSKELTVHPNHVFAVGSAKLGFSIAPDKRYRPFGDTSDIDLAVISPVLFDQLWESVFTYRDSVGFWATESRFKDYLFRGWIRPDMLPSGKLFPLSNEWFSFFRKLTASGRFGPYAINAGLYRSEFFFEQYHLRSVRRCHAEMEGS